MKQNFCVVFTLKQNKLIWLWKEMQSELIAQFDDNWLIIFSLVCVRIDAVLCHLMGNKESSLSLRLLVWQKKHLKMFFHNVICPTCSPSDISVNRNSGSFYGSPERQKWGTKYKLKNIILTSCCHVLHTGEKTDQIRIRICDWGGETSRRSAVGRLYEYSP